MSTLVKKGDNAIAAETISADEIKDLSPPAEIDPLTCEEFLRSPQQQYRMFSDSMRDLYQQRKAKRPSSFTKIPLQKKREWAIGLGPAAVPPFGSITAAAKPDGLFRGDKIISTGDGDGLSLTGLFVGKRSQFPMGRYPIPMSTFAEDLPGSSVLMDTCEESLLIAASAYNATAATLTWAVTIMGMVVL